MFDHIGFPVRDAGKSRTFYSAALVPPGVGVVAEFPGLRPDYHASYYGAFALDPHGHNVEAVCHSAESA
jgi:catechol 2,3-dioxygenase-like lactoylglutathione lyase family enzyme